MVEGVEKESYDIAADLGNLWGGDDTDWLHGDDGDDRIWGENHGDFLYEPSMRIPLNIRLPGGERSGERVGSQTTLMDLMRQFVSVASGRQRGFSYSVRGELFLVGPRDRRLDFERSGELDGWGSGGP